MVHEMGLTDVKLTDIDTTISGTAVTGTSASDPDNYQNKLRTTSARGSAAGALGAGSALGRAHSGDKFVHQCFVHWHHWLEPTKCG
jgi:hypothetical protein